METIKYLDSLLTNRNSVHEEIKYGLKPGNSCYYSVRNLLSSRFLSKKLKIRMYKTIILRVKLKETLLDNLNNYIGKM